jgi:aminoglycoside 3-N-acetyltransferase
MDDVVVTLNAVRRHAPALVPPCHHESVVQHDSADDATSTPRYLGERTNASADVGRGEGAVVAATVSPVTSTGVADALRGAGVRRGDTVIVHSSLSALGWVVGGPMSVVHALLDAVGVRPGSDASPDDGTIVMPAQTGISDPSTWQNPPVPEAWWPTIRAEWPAFDPFVTPLRGMGAIADCFRRLPGVRHSGHPATAFVALGRHADTITAEQPLSDSCGDTGPLGRLYELDATIVLIGVGHGNNTSLHLAESRAYRNADDAHEHWKTQGAPMLVDGLRTWVVYDDIDFDDEDFPALAEAWVEAGGVERRVEVGNAEISVCSMRDLVDFGTSWTSARRTGRPA